MCNVFFSIKSTLTDVLTRRIDMNSSSPCDLDVAFDENDADDDEVSTEKRQTSLHPSLFENLKHMVLYYLLYTFCVVNITYYSQCNASPHSFEHMRPADKTNT